MGVASGHKVVTFSALLSGFHPAFLSTRSEQPESFTVLSKNYLTQPNLWKYQNLCNKQERFSITLIQDKSHLTHAQIDIARSELGFRPPSCMHCIVTDTRIVIMETSAESVAEPLTVLLWHNVLQLSMFSAL